jgi:putative endonuclease
MQRNFVCRLGEIDLVMAHGEVTVFVEVRYRGQGSLGKAVESVTRTKQLKLSRAAGIFLSRNPALAVGPCRFDVISIDADTPEPRLEWIRNAFDSLLH